MTSTAIHHPYRLLPLVVSAALGGCAWSGSDSTASARWRDGWREGVVSHVGDQPTLGPVQCGARIEPGTRFFTVLYRMNGKPHWVSRPLGAMQAPAPGQAGAINVRSCDWQPETGSRS